MPELTRREAEQLGRVSALDKVLHLYEHALGMELVAGEGQWLIGIKSTAVLNGHHSASLPAASPAGKCQMVLVLPQQLKERACSRAQVDAARRCSPHADCAHTLTCKLAHFQLTCACHHTHTADEMIVAFTQIDPADPSRRFSFAVKVQGDNTYEGATQIYRHWHHAQSRPHTPFGQLPAAHVLLLLSTMA